LQAQDGHFLRQPKGKKEARNMSTATATHEFIAHQNIGDSFSGVYYVEQAYIKLTVTNKEYTDMVLRDKSGSRPVKHWGKTDFKKGDFAFISAVVENYQGNPSIIAKNIEREDPPEDLVNYIPVYDDADKHSERFDELREKLAELDKALGNETCGLLVDDVFNNGKTYARFISAPGSNQPHYGREGGLLANTVRVTDSAFAVADQYHLTTQEKAILLAAGFLHRLGAMDAFNFEDCMPQETTRGILVGVDNLTMGRLATSTRRTVVAANKAGKTIDKDVMIRIMHCIASYGEVVQPMTKEALVLASAARSDREIVEAVEFIENDPNETEEFTAFDPNLGRRYFKG
jgi:3'-5' exoribonuclease